jgi:hypothetical protein
VSGSRQQVDLQEKEGRGGGGGGGGGRAGWRQRRAGTMEVQWAGRQVPTHPAREASHAHTHAALIHAHSLTHSLTHVRTHSLTRKVRARDTQ